MSETGRTFVIGHRNPDTDSICSAMAYAALCRMQGRQDVFPARAGALNRQTEFVLEALGQEPPQMLSDVYPRLRDILVGQPITIPADAPLVQALELMRQKDIRMLPVVEDDGQPLGALILKRLTEYVFIPRQSARIRQVMTSPASIQACLQAKALFLHNAEQSELLDLYVGAMAPDSFREHLAKAEPRRAVVLTGDRTEIQQDAITLGVRLLVVTGGLPVSQEVLSAAEQNGVSVLQSAYDTATSALLARLSTPVRHLAVTDIPKVNPDDRVENLRRSLVRANVPGALVLNRIGQLVGVATKSNLLRSSSIRLILVDHNELSQAVPGAEQVDILEVIDHHRLGNFHTEAPIRFINQPLGSTCSVVATLFQQAGIEPDAQVAGLMLAGLLSDTVLLRSPTTTETDRQLLPWLGKLARIDPMTFGQQIFCAGSALGAYAGVSDMLTADFKEYEVGDRRIGISQIEVVDFQEFRERQRDIAAGLAELANDRQLNLVGLLITDIVQQTSQLLVHGDSDLVELIGYPSLANNLFELKGVLSRKKQLMPHLLKVLKKA